VTIALIAGAGAALLLLVALEELELIRHGQWMRRALVGRGAPRQGLGLGTMRERASAGELPLRIIQAGAVATLVLFLMGLALRSLSLSLVAIALGVGASYAFAQRRRWTLAARVERQLPAAMAVMASALSAGGTLFQSVEAASRETPPPLGPLLRRAVGRAQVAVTIDEALRELRDRVGSRDLGSLVTALAIQRTTGGDLARLLRESAEFLREEQRLRGDARALSAQARYSSQMIGVMPLLLFVLFSALFPSFVAPLTDTTIGLLVLVYSAASTGLGFWFIWRIATAIERI
jgi:tight adherence protein B